MPHKPNEGEIWQVQLDPTMGHEQNGKRPCLVVSVNELNHGPADLAIVLPITSKQKNVASHVEVNAPEGGLRKRSFIKCEDIRSVSIEKRFVERLGTVTPDTLTRARRILRLLLKM